MRKFFIAFAMLFIMLLCLCSCSNENSNFCIQFIDVGQGDSALIECDGHYMLIDGGDTTAGDKVYSVLEEKGIQKLDILAVSHLHTDHYGGLIKALSYASNIGVTISNSTYSSNENFGEFEHQLSINGSKITVPSQGDKYKLGSATVEVIDVASEADNDSLVLLIVYKETEFLFTGDIEEKAQTRISEKYQNDKDEAFEVELVKIPHHGSYTGTLYRFMRTFMPDYVIISVGAGNKYGHPDSDTLDLLNSQTWSPKVYRTDKNGDIFVKSNGYEIFIEASK